MAETTTVDGLNDRWNELRNLIFGRGTRPLVPALADEFASAHNTWKSVYKGAGRLLDGLTVETLNNQVKRYNGLVTRYNQATGKQVPKASSATSYFERAAEAVTSPAVTSVAKGVAVMSFAFLLLKLMRGGKG